MKKIVFGLVLTLGVNVLAYGVMLGYIYANPGVYNPPSATRATYPVVECDQPAPNTNHYIKTGCEFHLGPLKLHGQKDVLHYNDLVQGPTVTETITFPIGPQSKEVLGAMGMIVFAIGIILLFLASYLWQTAGVIGATIGSMIIVPFASAFDSRLPGPQGCDFCIPYEYMAWPILALILAWFIVKALREEGAEQKNSGISKTS